METHIVNFNLFKSRRKMMAFTVFVMLMPWQLKAQDVFKGYESLQQVHDVFTWMQGSCENKILGTAGVLLLYLFFFFMFFYIFSFLGSLFSTFKFGFLLLLSKCVCQREK